MTSRPPSRRARSDRPGPPRPRRARTERHTRETRIAMAVGLDGSGQAQLDTGVPFLDHMLELVCRHGLIDLEVKASGDLAVDYHHLVEDVGIVLGLLVRQALGDAKGISRYGDAAVPIDEALALVVVDVSGRGFLATGGCFEGGWIRDFDLGLLEEFFRAFAMNAGITLHIRMLSGVNAHHKAEAAFKGFARALRAAVTLDPRSPGVPSTKGLLL